MTYNYINGTSGNDTLNGTSSWDYIRGFAGNDTLSGADGTAPPFERQINHIPSASL